MHLPLAREEAAYAIPSSHLSARDSQPAQFAERAPQFARQALAISGTAPPLLGALCFSDDRVALRPMTGLPASCMQCLNCTTRDLPALGLLDTSQCLYPSLRAQS